MARERVHANNSWRTYDGDSPQDRDSQRRAWSGADIGQRHSQPNGSGRFGSSRSTQDFDNENARQFNRGREGDQEWRINDYDSEDYMRDNRASEYGERRGFSGYGRAKYDPDINRDWDDPLERDGMTRQSSLRDTESGRYSMNGNGYHEEEEEGQTIPYASHKNGQRAHGRNQRHEYMGGERSYGDRDAQRGQRPRSGQGMRSASKILVPVLVLGGFAVLAGVVQAIAPRVIDAIGGIFKRD
jgi:hypothetical protein